MTVSRRLLIAPILAMLACGSPSAQSGQSVDELRKEVEALKASQAEMQKSLDEIRDFLKAATGGRFGRPGLVDASLDISDAPVNGDAKAPVTLVEISDYHCPFCRRHVQQVQPKLYSDYVQTGKVRHVFIHYPIEQLHPDAYKSHEAASCAADQGKFWELHAKLFEAPAKTNEQLTALAQGAGLDANAFRTCLESGKYSQTVKESVSRVQQLGVSGTPMFLIGMTPRGSETLKVKKTVEGAQPFSAFKTAIDAVLAQK
jgi:protein-disulfide isomerase